MPLKIYYLDDEEALCENFFDYFTSKDVIVTTFTDPNVAIDIIKKNPPDIFFIDYRLPGTTGDEVAKVLDPLLPKFLITGDIYVKTEYPFNSIFSKPVSEEEIFKVIATYAQKKSP
jgi:CheY-like chemotaxis protein